MKLIKPSYEILEQGPGLEGIYEAIERAGRTCYKSTRPEGQTAKNFVDRMIASKHLAMCEHGTLYFKIPANIDVAGNFLDEVPTWTKCKLVESQEGNWWAITTNLRVMIEHFAPEYTEELIEKYLCEPTEFHEKRVMVKFSTDIGVTREANRHRKNSVAEQSTRYCNYSKDKFGGNIAVAIPTDIKESDIYHCINQFSDPGEDPSTFYNMCTALVLDKEEFNDISTWLFANLACEWAYMRLIKLGWKPQQARRILPLDTHSEIVHTAFVSDWQHCFDLRVDGTTGKPHPDMKALMSPVKEEFIKRGYINAN